MRKQISYQQKQIHYSVTGKGPVIVFVHGFGEDSKVWRKQQNAFPNYTLIIPDLPGSGASEMIEDMSMEGLAKVLEVILNEERIDQCVMIGHSMGGYITLAFAEKLEQRLKGFGLFHSTAYADSETKKEIRQKGIAFIKEHGAFPFLRTSIPNLFGSSTQEQNQALIEEQIQLCSGFTDAALITYYESMMERPDRTVILKNTALPVLFMLGEYDTAVPLQDGLQQCHLPKLSYVHILEESGHMGMLEETTRSNKYVLNYITDILKIS